MNDTEDYSDYEVEDDDEDAGTAGREGQPSSMQFGSRSTKSSNKRSGASKDREEDLDDSEGDEEAPDARTPKARGGEASASKHYQAMIDENENDGDQAAGNQSDKQVSPKATQRSQRNRPFNLNSSAASLE